MIDVDPFATGSAHLDTFNNAVLSTLLFRKEPL
jgi:hypothetical protein